MSRARAAIILAAGLGTRMKSELPKVLHQVGGRPMLDWAIAAASGVGCARVIVVCGVQTQAVAAHAAKQLGAGAVVVQDAPLGTAHAVRAAEGALKDFNGDAIVLYGDAPLVRAETLEAMFAKRTEKGGLAVLGFEAANPTGYGRLVLAEDGAVARIVEEKDATEAERAITLCNSGVVCADGGVLFQLLSMVRNDNAKKEFYLTDVVGLGRSAGFATQIVLGEENQVLGVNSRGELAAAEAAFQQQARKAAMENGVTMIDPTSVFFAYDTAIANDVIIEPNVFFGPGVRIARGARIKAHSHIEGAEIGEGANVGPFARLRPGTKLGPKAKIGNFVEVKNATFGERAQASHLTYVGDADVGARANLGAGTITCNYDGFDKYRTTIGEDAFIGSDTALVAPVKVGARAFTGSGSVITKDVADGALAVARGRQREIEGWADAFRASKRKPKP
ncbi:MAG TPA: bifunctional UDP-N-acetylglucosamine diphosphorylase/glucosamine-1-phosphate N-acetyltransferase GlmU [Caulobacterales bacterium]|nr:bifunctional UDP-N-acetylglucosamine diphosphorylase/glucosamine-1-phosphate N-acetyltransferase GlmU [Caulobacterales bacterium]